MKKPYKSIRIFKSDWLEKFTHIHPITPLAFWSPVVAFFLWRSVAVLGFSVWEIAGIMLFAILVWSLTEYCLHRFLFHYEAGSRIGERIVFLLHGIHHDDPQDPTRLVMPPLVAVALAVPLYGIFRLFLGPLWVEPFFAGFILGYLWYDYTHYAVHHFTPRTRFGKILKQHHMLHHYATPEARWGVSTPIWDYVFGSVQESSGRPKKSPAA